jgi:hypothetical protein
MFAPGMAILIVVLATNLVGDKLTEKFSGTQGTEEVIDVATAR